MRRAILLPAAMMVALVLASGVALAQVITCPMGGDPCVGTNGNDTLNGTSDPDEMRAFKGQDILNAGPERDTLNGGQGDDTLKGEEDKDFLSGDLGNDTLIGGPGDDDYGFDDGWGKDRLADDAAQGVSGERLTFSLVARPVKMDLISSDSRPEVESGANTVNYGPNVEINSIDGSSAGDDIKGDNGPDSINGIQGNDTIRGRAGVDDLMGMDGSDDLFGGSGEDNFDAGKGADVVHAADGEKDQVLCGPGNDTAFFDQGLDDLQGCEN